MKKALLMVIIIIATLTPSLLQAQKLGDKKTFQQVYLETLELNKDRFPDPRLIPIGDTVLLAAKTFGGKTQYMLADSVNNGIHDCIWHISTRYVANELDVKPIQPEETTEVKVPVESLIKEKPSLLLLIIIIGLATFIALYFLLLLIKRGNDKEKNPDNHPPVIPEGLSEDMATAARQILVNSNNPDEIIGLKKIIYVREGGAKKWIVTMGFGDDVQRAAYILPGEYLHEALRRRTDGSTYEELNRSSCGNPVYPIVRDTINGIQLDHNGRIIHPKDWKKIVIQDYMAPEVIVTSSPENKQEVVEQPAQEKPKTPPTLIPEGDLTAKLIKAAGKNVASIEIVQKETSMEVLITFK